MMLAAVMEAFALLPGADVGAGPDHPGMPVADRRSDIDSFLRRFPQLARDPAYVDFLYAYSGAGMTDVDADTYVDVFGFSDVSTEFDESEGPLIEEDGYLIFAVVIYQRGEERSRPATVQLSF